MVIPSALLYFLFLNLAGHMVFQDAEAQTATGPTTATTPSTTREYILCNGLAVHADCAYEPPPPDCYCTGDEDCYADEVCCIHSEVVNNNTVTLDLRCYLTIPATTTLSTIEPPDPTGPCPDTIPDPQCVIPGNCTVSSCDRDEVCCEVSRDENCCVKWPQFIVP